MTQPREDLTWTELLSTPVDAQHLSDAVRTRIRSLQARLRAMSKLEQDWDNEGAVAVQPKTVENAKRFIEIILSSSLAHLLAPNVLVGPIADGGIRFEWKNQNRELFITINDDSFEIQSWQPLEALDSEGYWKTDFDGVVPHIAWLLE